MTTFERKYRTPLTALVLAACTVGFGGCLKTIATIDSTPPGAAVYFDSHRQPDVTPTQVEVEWNGGHKITLVKEGFETHSEVVDIDPPGYLWIPLDLGATLIPYNFEDTHEFHFELTPKASGTASGESN